MMKNKNVLFLIIFVFIVHAQIACAIPEQNLVWSTGNDYTMTPSSNLVTQGNYTIKAVDFPPPVRGGMSVNGTIIPINPVVPAVYFEIYKDMVNNTTPIGTFSLTAIGDYYITPDQQLKVTLEDIPGSESQDWVYEYYAPQATITVQNRAIPSLNIGINILDSTGTDVGDTDLTPGYDYTVQVSINNTGDDVIQNVNYNINIGSLILKSLGSNSSLKGSIYQLAAGNTQSFNINVEAPLTINRGEYKIDASATGVDTFEIPYYANTSRITGITGDIGSVYITKQSSKNTTYLSETVHVMLEINGGCDGISNVQLEDDIPDNLIFVNSGLVQANGNKILMSKPSIGGEQQWIVEYNLKPTEPGTYVLPAATINFTLAGSKYNMTSGETGFVVYGPIIVLNKSITDMGNNTVEINVNATNIGNGFTSATITDQIPDGTTLTSGQLNWKTTLNTGEEKDNSYTVRLGSGMNLNTLSWPAARADYLLDDYRFNTTSNGTVRMAVVGNPIITPIPTITVTPNMTETAIATEIQPEETERNVVATIPPPGESETHSGKTTPGFTIDILIAGMIIALIMKKIRIKR